LSSQKLGNDWWNSCEFLKVENPLPSAVMDGIDRLPRTLTRGGFVEENWDRRLFLFLKETTAILEHFPAAGRVTVRWNAQIAHRERGGSGWNAAAVSIGPNLSITVDQTATELVAIKDEGRA
jgi:hypothetical protein